MYNRVREVRKHFKLSQTAFGEKLGVSRDVISNVEQNRVNENNLFIEHLCSVFGVSERWLRTGEGEMLQQDSQSVLDRMADEYSLTRRELAVISAFLELDSADRAAVMRYVDNLVDKLAPTSAAVDDATAAGIAAMQDYARMVSEEKEAEERSSTSAG